MLTRITIKKAIPIELGEFDSGYIGLLLKYTEQYKTDPKLFLTCFLKFRSIRSVCEQLVFTSWKTGALDEAKELYDFSDWVEKQPVDQRGKEVLNDILILIKSIINV